MIVWSILLSLSLLLAQGITLHVHVVDHSHADHNHTHMDIGHDGHTHLSEAHFAHDDSHGDHHEDVLSEVDVSPDGVLKDSSTQVLLFAFFFVVFLSLVTSAGLTLRRRSEDHHLRYHCYHLSPPLRAPPQ